MILVDSHVHIYDCFNAEAFFTSALVNFETQAVRYGRTQDFTAFLLLTETARDNWFSYLKDYAGGGFGAEKQVIENWTFHHTEESWTLWAQRENAGGLYVIAGRQIVTAEDLEVLALITDGQFKDGLPLEEVVQAVKESGGIPVIPWGFGKWLGRRGRILTSILDVAEEGEIFLGDNSARPALWTRPTHFKIAEAKGIRILPGSDPLPFVSEYWRAGRFGFSAGGSVASEHPGSDLKRILLDANVCIRPYGELEKSSRFFRNQVTMQINKQLRKRNLVN